MTSGAGAPLPFTSQPRRRQSPPRPPGATQGESRADAGRTACAPGKTTGTAARRWRRRARSSRSNRPSVQLDARLGAAFEEPRQGIERDADWPVKRVQVHLVQRQVHQARKPALDTVALAGEKAHQRPDRAVFSERNQGTEVAVAKRSERRPDHELVDPVGFESVEIPEEIRPLDSRRPDREVRRVGFAALGLYLACRDFDRLFRACDDDAEVFERPGHGLGDSLWEHRQDSWIGVEKGDMEEMLRFYVLKAVCGEYSGCVVQLGGKLDPCRPCTDDHHAQLTRRAARPIVGLEAGVDQAPVEAVSFDCRLEGVGVLGNTWNAESVRDTADCDHQSVVAQRAARDHFDAALIRHGPHRYLAARAVEALERAEAEVEVMPASLRQVVELVGVNVHAPGGNLVQEGLPEMGFVLVHEGDGGARPEPEAVPCPGRELKPPRAAAYDNDAMGIGHGIFGRPRNADMIFVQDYA